jgi:hypothetical protein
MNFKGKKSMVFANRLLPEQRCIVRRAHNDAAWTTSRLIEEQMVAF